MCVGRGCVWAGVCGQKGVGRGLWARWTGGGAYRGWAAGGWHLRVPRREDDPAVVRLLLERLDYLADLVHALRAEGVVEGMCEGVRREVCMEVRREVRAGR